MLYNLLKDIRRQLGAKTPLTAEEQCLLERIDHAVPHIRRDGDAEWLQPGEVLVRVCPDTGRPVLVCHDGEGQCTCLHNETVAEDAADVRLWLSSPGRAYNAGADKLWDERDSRAVVSEIIRWAGEFETTHAGTDWAEEDYLLAIDSFYQEKISDL